MHDAVIPVIDRSMIGFTDIGLNQEQVTPSRGIINLNKPALYCSVSRKSRDVKALFGSLKLTDFNVHDLIQVVMNKRKTVKDPESIGSADQGRF